MLIYFRKDIARILSAWFRSLTDRSMRGDHDAQMGWLVIVGSIPIGVLGITLKDQIEGPFRDLRLIATTLIVMGIVLGIADRLAARDESGGKHRVVKERKTLKDLGVRDGLIFGFCQAMALIPGVSRSGATISGGLLMGYTRESAARYSFLLAIPRCSPRAPTNSRTWARGISPGARRSSRPWWHSSSDTPSSRGS